MISSTPGHGGVEKKNGDDGQITDPVPHHLATRDVLLVLRINGLFHPYKGRLDTSRK